MKAIYRLHFDCQRQGELEGIFIAEKEDVEILISSQTQVYFGEVLGKHSEIAGSIEPNELELVTDDEEAVAIFEKYNLQSGYNPFNHSAASAEGTVQDVVNSIKILTSNLGLEISKQQNWIFRFKGGLYTNLDRLRLLTLFKDHSIEIVDDDLPKMALVSGTVKNIENLKLRLSNEWIVASENTTYNKL